VQRGGVKIVYDGDGNRVQETVAGVVTRYLTGEVNPTGYVQVMAELSGTNQILRGYEWGLQLAAVRDFTVNSGGIFHYYGLDGHGSVRFLTSSTGAVTDTYDYDAFGNLISSTGTTFNNYMFAGEQFDPALGIYYNRARYYDQRQGRFWTMDTFEGDPESPASLHRYLYAGANPVNRVDPSGYLIEQETAARGIGETIDAEVTQLYRQIGAQIARKLVAAGVVLGGGYIGFLISTVTPDPVPSTATQNPQSSPTQTGEDEPGGDAIWLYRTGNSTRVDPPRILGFNRTAQQSYDMAPDTSNKLFGPFPWPDGASTFRSPARLSGHIWKVQKGAIYSELGLGVIADGVDAVPPGPRGAGHHTIFPIVPMSPEDFTNAFYALPWLPAGKK
jgi:RHS repeat-associated protein